MLALLKAIAENKTEQKLAAKRRQRWLLCQLVYLLPGYWGHRSTSLLCHFTFTTLVLSLATLNSFAVGRFLSPSPPLRFNSFISFCGFWLFDSCGFFVGRPGRVLLALLCFCDFSGRGVRSPVEPWTRLHCSEHYCRCPVVLPAVQSGAP